MEHTKCLFLFDALQARVDQTMQAALGAQAAAVAAADRLAALPAVHGEAVEKQRRQVDEAAVRLSDLQASDSKNQQVLADASAAVEAASVAVQREEKAVKAEHRRGRFAQTESAEADHARAVAAAEARLRAAEEGRLRAERLATAARASQGEASRRLEQGQPRPARGVDARARQVQRF